jgi:hypothetical protein
MIRPFADQPDLLFEYLFYRVYPNNPGGIATVFTDRFWDHREHWFPQGVGVLPWTLKPYFGPLPPPTLGTVYGTPEEWIHGLDYETYQSGGYNDVPCWPLQPGANVFVVTGTFPTSFSNGAIVYAGSGIAGTYPTSVSGSVVRYNGAVLMGTYPTNSSTPAAGYRGSVLCGSYPSSTSSAATPYAGHVATGSYPTSSSSPVTPYAGHVTTGSDPASSHEAVTWYNGTVTMGTYPSSSSESVVLYVGAVETGSYPTSSTGPPP